MNLQGFRQPLRAYRPKIRPTGLDSGNRRLRQPGEVCKFSLRQFGKFTGYSYHLSRCQVDKRFGWSGVQYS